MLSEAQTGAAPHPSRRNERTRALPRIEQLPETSSVSGPTRDKYRTATKTLDEITAGFGVRAGCRARPVDEHDVHRRTQNLAGRTGGGRPSLLPPRVRQGWQQVNLEVSQVSQRLEEAAPIVLEETADVACVVRQRLDKAWIPFALDHGAVIGRVLLTPLRGSEPHRKKLAPSGGERSPTLGRAPFPTGNGQRSKVRAADDTVAIDSGRLNWMRRVSPVLADQGSSRPLFKTDYQSFLEVFRKAANNTGTETVLYQMRHLGPSWDLAQGVRDITSFQKQGRWTTMTSLKRYEKHGHLNDTWRLLSPKTQANCLTCEHNAPRRNFGPASSRQHRQLACVLGATLVAFHFHV